MIAFDLVWKNFNFCLSKPNIDPITLHLGVLSTFASKQHIGALSDRILSAYAMHGQRMHGCKEHRLSILAGVLSSRYQS